MPAFVAEEARRGIEGRGVLEADTAGGELPAQPLRQRLGRIAHVRCQPLNDFHGGLGREARRLQVDKDPKGYGLFFFREGGNDVVRRR